VKKLTYYNIVVILTNYVHLLVYSMVTRTTDGHGLPCYGQRIAIFTRNYKKISLHYIYIITDNTFSYTVKDATMNDATKN